MEQFDIDRGARVGWERERWGIFLVERFCEALTPQKNIHIIAIIVIIMQRKKKDDADSDDSSKPQSQSCTLEKDLENKVRVIAAQ